ncbi:MAG TPA: alpha/beta hydrolase [Rhizomicrobium sp.]|nr:alpha/beta hydrolase [Rhizomicrobium sp.]
MIPAQECFAPQMLPATGARLRTATFAAPARDRGAKDRGVCVLLNGQTEFIEKYFEVIDELRGRGFTVVALDWRGQGGSERLLPEEPLKAHIHDFTEYDADLDALMDRVVEPLLSGRRPIALAHSMGGHNLLRHLRRRPERFAATAYSAPMLMFSTRGQPRWLVRLVTAMMTMSGRGTDFVWGIAGRDPLTMTFADQIVTSDPVRFERTQQLLRAHPELRLAGPTWAWVAAAWRSLNGFALRNAAEQVTTPSLICGAGHDRICITDDARRFARRMPHAEYLELAGCEHEILMERNVFRAQFWNAFDRFMEKYV